MKFDSSSASFLLALIGAVSGWVAWWLNKARFDRQQTILERQQAIQEAKAASEKAVNKERDFNHLRNNQVQISQGIATGFDEIERRLDYLREQMIEIKSYLIQTQGITRGE